MNFLINNYGDIGLYYFSKNNKLKSIYIRNLIDIQVLELIIKIENSKKFERWVDTDYIMVNVFKIRMKTEVLKMVDKI